MAVIISEEYRLAAKSWVDADAAASLLEECKSANLSQMMQAHGDIAVSKAEMYVKASPEWTDYITKMVNARKEANLLKVRCEWLRMRFSEQQSTEATARAERRL